MREQVEWGDNVKIISRNKYISCGILYEHLYKKYICKGFE